MNEESKKLLQELLAFCEKYDCNVNVSTTRDFDNNKVDTIYLHATTFDENAMPNVITFKIGND